MTLDTSRPRLLAAPRPGYAHFERVHRVVGERACACAQCHQELAVEGGPHRIDPAKQVDNCRFCHVSTGTAMRQRPRVPESWRKPNHERT